MKNINEPVFKIGDKVRARPEYWYDESDNCIYTVADIVKRDDPDIYNNNKVAGNFNFIIRDADGHHINSWFGWLRKIFDCPEYMK